jgi:hypothetical protein
MPEGGEPNVTYAGMCIIRFPSLRHM